MNAGARAWPGAEKWAFAALFAIAAALRFAVALTTGAVHPDEIFQYLEQAHRAAFGYGVVPWEYRYGMRSWLLPLTLSPLMRLGEALAPGTQLYLILPKLLMACLSLLVLPAAFSLGARLSRFHGWVAMIVAAIWYEIVYFGGHVLTEPAAVALILPAAALLLNGEQTRRRVALAGFLLGMAAILRFHYLPAMAVLVLFSCARSWRERLVPLLAGGAAAGAIGSIVDLATGLAPFGWLWSNFGQNIIANRSADFGVSPPLAYLATLNYGWSLAFWPILLLQLPVMRKYYPLILMALVNIAVHSAIGHKEYRFIFLSSATLVIVAAIGSTECVRLLGRRLSPWWARLSKPTPILVWMFTSAILAASGSIGSSWHAFSAGSETIASLRRVPGLCGVGLVDVDFWDTGGYSYLHRPTPFYVARTSAGGQSKLRQLAPAFNAILAPTARPWAVPPGYRRLACSSARGGQGGSRTIGLCTYVRSGGCNPAVARHQRLEAVMRRRNW